MLYELRIYTCRPGSRDAVLKLWEERGQAMIDRHIEMVGQWTPDSGNPNEIYTLWRFRSWEERKQARQVLVNDPDFAKYLSEVRAHYLEQRVTFLTPSKLSPMQ
jgi:hypothetical protein